MSPFAINQRSSRQEIEASQQSETLNRDLKASSRNKDCLPAGIERLSYIDTDRENEALNTVIITEPQPLQY